MAFFNPTYPAASGNFHGWVLPWHFGINEGPTILMIWNYRTGMKYEEGKMSGAKGQDPNDANRSRDPVCGMNVGSDSPHRGVHAGTSYLFCSAHCLSEFRQDPGKYAGTIPDEGEHDKKDTGPGESGTSVPRDGAEKSH